MMLICCHVLFTVFQKHLHQENEQMGYFGCSEDEESGDEDVRKKRRKSEKGNLQNEIPESTCTCDRSLVSVKFLSCQCKRLTEGKGL